MATKQRRQRARPAPSAQTDQAPADAVVGSTAHSRVDAIGAADPSILLAQARRLWQQGDWSALAEVTPADVFPHPDRARLALMAAGAQLQLGRQGAARQWLSQAQAWGCEPQLLRRVLVSGLHNTLARAAALAGDQSRAISHFAAALATTTPASAGRTALEARAGMQLAQLGLSLPEVPGEQAAGNAARPAWITMRSTVVVEGLHGQAAPSPALLATPSAVFAAASSGGPFIRMLHHRYGADDASSFIRRELSVPEPTDGAWLDLGRDAYGRLLVAFARRGAVVQWQHTGEPDDIRPWSAMRSLPCKWVADTPPRILSRDGRPALLLLHDPAARLLRHDAGRQTWSDCALPAALRAPPLLAATSDGCLCLLESRTHVASLPIACALSDDDGATWRPGPSLSLPDAQKVTLAAVGRRSVHVLAAAAEDSPRRLWHAWLDGRNWRVQALATSAWHSTPALVVDHHERAWIWGAPAHDPDGLALCRVGDGAPLETTPLQRASDGAACLQFGHQGQLSVLLVEGSDSNSGNVVRLHELRPL